MRIALIGYGKMGKIIEEIAISRGHSISARSTSKTMIDQIDFSEVDVAIEFTTPDLAVQHIQHCVDQKTPVVVGTTAWDEQLPFVKDYVIQNGGSLLYASNFSIGVNIFFDLNRRLAKLMSTHTKYDVKIEEAHHMEKLDAPSGTAVTLANDVLSQNENLTSWVHEENETPTTNPGQVGVTSYRKPNVPGTHTIKYNSEIDSIEMTHTAHSRTGFGLGAVISAEWLHGRKGVYTMQDIIKH
ncbi:MAG: 4-hydroxy-tetrahydrodipicolinate reductase [Flavobacteriaceae bacterium]|jgi:4-hydroxy-tetrahydrodipicolinate reductase